MRQVPKDKILLGITGSIAAYKSAELTRLFIKNGYDVKVVMTKTSQEFIGKNTFAGITGNDVHSSIFTDAMAHIELARWVDGIIIAPASANCIAKLAHGICDDLLTNICLATKAPISIAPAMNQNMWLNAATQDNISILQRRGVNIIGPDLGEQACGDTGPGRMVEPEVILTKFGNAPVSKQNLAGKKVLITAGPTYERIDPVRFIGNYSSGKMGYAIAQEAIKQGAKVTLISGPSSLSVPAKVEFIAVTSAQEMFDKVLMHITNADVFISAAAVADYRPLKVANTKLKKHANNLTLELEKTPDILYHIGRLPRCPFLVGFAAETDNLLGNAKYKLTHKGLDMIVANEVSEGQPFGSDVNTVSILKKDGGLLNIKLASKIKIAHDIVMHIAHELHMLMQEQK